MKFNDKKIIQAIQNAESHTSGEIQVHIASLAGENIYDKAKLKFEELGITQTKERNGILFFIAKKSKRFAILGDSGIHEKVKQGFWNDLRNELSSSFKQGNFTAGLCETIELCGQKLKEHFPSSSNNQNELSNEPSKS
jgi:uncharacterized membrane protein